MSRLRPCVETKITTNNMAMSQNDKTKSQNDKTGSQNDNPGSQNDNPESQNDKTGSQNDNPESQNDKKCKWCLNTFSRNFTLNKHTNVCKLVDDPIRKLEMELGIIPDLKSCVCRFCKKSYKCISRHECKKQAEYLESIKIKKRTTSGNVYNINKGTINNIYKNINNVTVNLDASQVIEELRVINKVIGGKLQPYLTAGKWITAVETMVREDPGNRTVSLASMKSMEGMILTENGWVAEPADFLVEQTFKFAAQHLHNMENNLVECNPRVIPANNETWREVGHFAKDGLNYKGFGGSASGGDQVRKLRTAFKVAMVNYSNKKNTPPADDF
jgi:hypothetical protein